MPEQGPTCVSSASVIWSDKVINSILLCAVMYVSTSDLLLSHLKWSKQDNRICCTSTVLSRAICLSGISPVFTEHHLTCFFNCINHFWLNVFFIVFFTSQRAIIQLLGHLLLTYSTMVIRCTQWRCWWEEKKNLEICRRCTDEPKLLTNAKYSVECDLAWL